MGGSKYGMVTNMSMISNASVVLITNKLGSYHQHNKSWGEEHQILVQTYLEETSEAAQQSIKDLISRSVMALTTGSPGLSPAAPSFQGMVKA